MYVLQPSQFTNFGGKHSCTARRTNIYHHQEELRVRVESHSVASNAPVSSLCPRLRTFNLFSRAISVGTFPAERTTTHPVRKCTRWLPHRVTATHTPDSSLCCTQSTCSHFRQPISVGILPMGQAEEGTGTDTSEQPAHSNSVTLSYGQRPIVRDSLTG